MLAIVVSNQHKLFNFKLNKLNLFFKIVLWLINFLVNINVIMRLLLLLLHLLLMLFQFLLLNNLFIRLQDLLWLLRIILIPYLIQHTNEQMLSLHTLSRIYDQFLRKLQQLQLSLKSFILLSLLWLNLLLVLQLVVDS